MQFFFTQRFKKRFAKLSLKIQRQFEKRMVLFMKNQNNPLLRIHPLKGNLTGLRAFSVTGDVRVIFCFLSKDRVELTDVQVYDE